MKIPFIILFIGKASQFVSANLAAKYVKFLFQKPIKYPLPKREFEMDKNSKQYELEIAKINKKVNVYEYGTGEKKVLLVHGWSGRGTQLFKIAEGFVEKGYQVISFDAPAHGKSPSKTSLMPEFIAAVHQLDKKYGGFEMAIGHSLGAMSVLNALKEGLVLKKAALISSGNSVEDIAHHFTKQLELKPKVAVKMIALFEKQFNMKMEPYSAYVAAKNIEIPLLIIHDKDDFEVPFSCSEAIHKVAKNSTLVSTNGLGHRKIVGAEIVVNHCVSFID